jgi:hypothetical protein
MRYLQPFSSARTSSLIGDPTGPRMEHSRKYGSKMEPSV